MKQLLFFVNLFLVSCSTGERIPVIKITEAFPNLTFEQPVDIQSPKDGRNRLFVVSQPGLIYVFENRADVKLKEVFLDIRKKVLSGGEMGLLGLAFHPNYKNNGYFYVNYTSDNPRRTIIAKYTVQKDNPSLANPGSEEILLEVQQPFANHNGGQIAFGPDGNLYISFGDGGSAGDPMNAGQDLGNLLGKILRIDVNSKSGGKNYAIPDDNPFNENSYGYKEEIYAYGLRNVWRFSFDHNNNLWAADVGQNKWEEINLVEKGKNYGWRIMEATHCYNPETNCDTAGLILPIWEYGHNDEGGFSITGGFVYNGNSASELKGKYVYADFVVGKIWSLNHKNNIIQNNLIKDTHFAISTFGTDENDELYFADYKIDGRLYRFESE